MFFVGAYELRIDDKNRCSVPHPVRSKMNCDIDGRSFYVLPGFRRGTLALYAEKYFEQLRQAVPPANQLADDVHEWRQFEYSHCYLLDPDSQGRVLIPERLLKQAGLGREVTMIGVQDHLELWNTADYEAFQAEQWPKYPQRRALALAEVKAGSPAASA